MGFFEFIILIMLAFIGERIIMRIDRLIALIEKYGRGKK